MTGSKPESRKHGLDSVFVEVLLEWLEIEDAFLYVFIPLILIFGVGLIGVMVYHWAFDPYYVDALSRMDAFSIDPDKWFPRV